MLESIVVASITFILLIISILFFPKIKFKNFSIGTHWIVSLLGALTLIIMKSISFKEILDGLLSEEAINPIKILVLFFSMTFLSIYLDEVGFFKYIASKMIRKCKSSQTKLFMLLYALVALLTIFTSNDIVILTFTPFICYFAKNAKINPIPYLVAEFAAANTWSMMLIIGNPTNIYLASSMNIDFISYLKVMFLPTLAAGVVQVLVIDLIFNKQLHSKLKVESSKVKIEDKPGLYIGLFHLLACLVLLTISAYINVAMWLIALLSTLSLLVTITMYFIVRHKKFKLIDNTFARLPYDLIPFMISMFVIVLALNKHGVTQIISDFLGDKNIVFHYGLTSFLSCNLMNNIPMSVLFSTVPNFTNSVDMYKAIYSIIIGSNIGAFLTPIGALAGIMFTGLIERQKVKYSFLSFIKIGLIISIPTLLVALIVLQLIFL